MPLGLPEDSEEVESRIKVDVAREAPDSNPYLANSWLGSILTAFGRRLFDFYRDLLRTTEQLFPDSTFLTDFIIRWGNIYGKQRQAATPSNGNAVATGIAGSTITLGSILASNGNEYSVTTSATISDNVVSVSSITRSGNTATVTTVSDHGLASNVPVTTSGAVETEYNVTDAEITVNGLDTFTYQVAGSPATPATGTIQAAYTSASVAIESSLEGQDKNLDADSPLTLQSPIAGVDNELRVDFGQVGGGTDQESLGSLQGRTLDKIQNPVAHFNVSDIKDKAREVPGVTRVFVEEVTPDVGQVTVYFMRDNDDNPIPSASEAQDVKAALNTIRPANTAEADLIVSPPTAVIVDFTFTNITPDTSTMRSAITANLEQFFTESTEVGSDLDEDAYRSAIINTVDIETGQSMQTFILSVPSGDIAIASGEIPVLGAVSYP